MVEILVVAKQCKAELQDEIEKIDWFLCCADTLLRQGEPAIPAWEFDAERLKAASSLKHDEPLAEKTVAPAAKDEERAKVDKPSAREVEAPVAEPAPEPNDELHLEAEARVSDEMPADENPAREKPEVASDKPVRRSLFRRVQFKRANSEAEAAA